MNELNVYDNTELLTLLKSLKHPVVVTAYNANLYLWGNKAFMSLHGMTSLSITGKLALIGFFNVIKSKKQLSSRM